MTTENGQQQPEESQRKARGKPEERRRECLTRLLNEKAARAASKNWQRQGRPGQLPLMFENRQTYS